MENSQIGLFQIFYERTNSLRSLPEACGTFSLLSVFQRVWPNTHSLMGGLHVRERFLFQKRSPAVTDLLIPTNQFSESTQVSFTSRSFVLPSSMRIVSGDGAAQISSRLPECGEPRGVMSHSLRLRLTVRVLDGTSLARTSRNWSSLT